MNWLEQAIQDSTRQQMEQWQANQERHQQVAELYDKMVSSGVFSDDELSLARFEFGL